MNLFRPAFKPEQFDVVLCDGVLHHTSDPRGGFLGLTRLVRPGGYLVVGLYGRWGRLITDLRRRVFRFTRGRPRWMDPHLRGTPPGDEKERAWLAQQYRHPYESKHTAGEVLRWFDDSGLEFVRGIPSLTLDDDATQIGDLFAPAPRGTGFDRLLTQAAQMVSGGREGGSFLMIGRKSAKPAPGFDAPTAGPGH
jgi:SAM-dependent methyltransferase